MSSKRLNNVTSLSPAALQRVARVFSTLAEPTRLRILQLLHDGPLTVGELVERMDVKQPCVSKQLGILHSAGLVERKRDGAQMRYWISEPIIFDLCRIVCTKLHRDAEQARALVSAQR